MKQKLQLNSRVMLINPNSILHRRIGRVVEFDQYMAWVSYPKRIQVPTRPQHWQKVWGLPLDELKVLPTKQKQQTKVKI